MKIVIIIYILVQQVERLSLNQDNQVENQVYNQFNKSNRVNNSEG